MLRAVHKSAAAGAYLLIISFFTSTILVEIFGSFQQIAFIKEMIFYAVFLLIPLMATAGITGNLLSRGIDNPIIYAKKRRMPFIALNGVFILIPLAYLLHKISSGNDIEGLFYLFQGAELFFGAINIYLMTRNILDGQNIRGITCESFA